MAEFEDSILETVVGQKQYRPGSLPRRLAVHDLMPGLSGLCWILLGLQSSKQGVGLGAYISSVCLQPGQLWRDMSLDQYHAVVQEGGSLAFLATIPVLSQWQC